MNAREIVDALKGSWNGSGGMACCPAHNDKNPSLSVTAKDDGRVLVYCHAGCTQNAVIEALKGRGLWPGDTRDRSGVEGQAGRGNKDDWHPVMPAPDSAPIPDLADCSAHWPYLNADGKILFYVLRFDKSGGKKAYFPLVYGLLNGVQGWHRRHPARPRPLYGLDKLADLPDAPVLVVEGEKTADAAQALLPDWAVVTWPGGCGAVGHADYSALAGRRVWLWPDRDRKVYPTNHKRAGEEKPQVEQPGMKAMTRASTMVTQASAVPTAIVDPPAPHDSKDGWDLADAVCEGWSGQRVATWLAEHSRGSLVGDPMRPSDDEEPSSPRFSDDQLALLFTAKLGSDLRFVQQWGKWFRWDGNRWAIDQTLNVFDSVRATCRIASTECDKPAIQRGIASAKTVAAVERLAKSDRKHAATVEQWDTHSWLLPTPGGEVDLRTGKIEPAWPEHYMTKATAVAPGGDCPLWRRFLERVTDGDKDLQQYLQRVVGYCLTGSVEEEALFFLHGTGQNGKGVFIHTLVGIFEEFHTAAPMEMFLFSKHDRHPTELAGLRGARLVTCTEVEEGRRWDEAKIKALTGSDTICARYMRQDFFNFVPAFKLMISGNHKPTLSHIDKAISRRFNLIPFTVTIPDNERDDKLAEKLKDEWPGIFRWAIDGAKMWASTGLEPPESVREATLEYLSAQDRMSLWIEDRCIEGTNEKESIADLWNSWRSWCDQTKEYSGKKTGFVDGLVSKGYRRTTIGKAGAKGLVGIRLVRKDELEIEPN